MVDTAKITICGGDGGDGAISFIRSKFKRKGPPDGGSGGNGGNVYFIADPNIATLKDFAARKLFKAQNGGRGARNDKAGKNGSDLYIRVPVGTSIKGLSKDIISLDKKGQKVLAARGGRGGRGNAHLPSDFASKRASINVIEYKGKKFGKNRYYYYAEKGHPGEKKEIKLELKLIADAGIIGLPNAGKTSLLNALTKSTKARVGAYPFTTLEPNLGVLMAETPIILADIPGLIEGAHKGKGLGATFLKHIEKTKVLIHVIDATRLDLQNIKESPSYKVIRNELKRWSDTLSSKPEIIVLNKMDLINGSPTLPGDQTIFASARTGEGLELLKKKIRNVLIKQRELEKKTKKTQTKIATFTIDSLPNKKIVFRRDTLDFEDTPQNEEYPLDKEYPSK